MFTSPIRHTLRALTASLLVLGPAAALSAATPAPEAVYSFRQHGDLAAFVLSPSEVLEIDASGREVLRKTTTTDRTRLLQRSRKPGADAKAAHLVFYPADQVGVESARCFLRERLLVTLAPDAAPEAVRERTAAAAIKPLPGSPGRFVLSFANAAEALASIATVEADPAVLAVEPLLARWATKAARPADPLYAFAAGAEGYQWHLRNTGENGALPDIDINAETAWDVATGTGITIGIVDDGIEIAHPDLAANYDAANSHNWNDGVATDPNPTSDADTHGTPVAGIAAAAWNNNEGGSGTAPTARLAGLRLIAGAFDDADIAEALSYQPDNIHVYNNSWNLGDGTTALQRPGAAVTTAIQNGVATGRGGRGSIYVWAAGNSAEISDNVNYDGIANMAETIAVGSVTDLANRPPYSEPGAPLVVCAPSDGGILGITTTNFQGFPPAEGEPFPFDPYTYTYGGTSASVPMVSGVVALMLQRNATLGWRDVQEILIRSATKVNPTDSDWVTNSAGISFNHSFGAGMVNAAQAVTMAQAWTNLGTRTNITQMQIPVIDVPDGDGNSCLLQFDMSASPNLRIEHVELVTTVIHSRRSDLEIVLVSPSGTQSILAQTHSGSAEQSISNWPFRTVRCWGEGSQGLWVLRVTDKREGNPAGYPGILNSARLRIFGVEDPGAPVSQLPVLVSPRTIRGVQGTPLAYKVETVGADTITVGTLPPGLDYNPATLMITGSPATVGVYSTPLQLSGPAGTADLDLSFIIEPLATALGPSIEQDSRPTTSSGDADWVYEFGETSDGEDSAGSPAGLADNQYAQFGFSLSQPEDQPKIDRVMIFNWRVSSEEGYDRLWLLTSGNPPQNWTAFIDGETPWMTVAAPIPASLSTVSWRYQKDLSEAYGLDRGFVDQVRFMSRTDFDKDVAEAADSNITLTQNTADKRGARTLWFPVDDTTAVGGSSLRTSAIGNGQFVILEAILTGPGRLNFNWKVSSDPNDRLTLLVNGLPNAEISGTANTAWQPVEVTTYDPEDPFNPANSLVEGPNLVQWVFSKDVAGRSGTDAAWLDSLVWTQEADFDSWGEQNFTPAQIAAGMADEDADPDRDGNTNFDEYAWGTNANAPDVSTRKPRITTQPLGGGFNLVMIQFTTDTQNTDLIYTMQESADLVHWTDVVPVLADSNGTLRTYQYDVLVPGFGPRNFYRVQVVRAP